MARLTDIELASNSALLGEEMASAADVKAAEERLAELEAWHNDVVAEIVKRGLDDIDDSVDTVVLHGPVWCSEDAACEGEGVHEPYCDAVWCTWHGDKDEDGTCPDCRADDSAELWDSD